MPVDPERFQNRRPANAPPLALPGSPSPGPVNPVPKTPPARGRSAGARPTPGAPSFGGYTAAQLKANPALVEKLGPQAAARWSASQKAPGSPPTVGSAPGGPPAGFKIPAWVQGTSEADRWAKYQDFLKRNPGARGNKILNRVTGGSWPPAGGGGFPPPSPPAGQAPVGSPLSPPGFPAPPGGGAGFGNAPNPYAFNDPFQMFLSAVPLMNANRDKQIADAMATAGFSGNRIGTAAANDAMRIGAETAMAQDALLANTLYQYANDTENRALQANQQGIQLGGLLNAIQQDQLMTPFQLGSWEQGRQDRFAQSAYDDFERNKLGWLPLMLQAAMSQGTGSPGQIYTTSEPGKPGAVDWLTALGPLLGFLG